MGEVVHLALLLHHAGERGKGGEAQPHQHQHQHQGEDGEEEGEAGGGGGGGEEGHKSAGHPPGHVLHLGVVEVGTLGVGGVDHRPAPGPPPRVPHSPPP